jgi:bla regulator protein BlaR1
MAAGGFAMRDRTFHALFVSLIAVAICPAPLNLVTGTPAHGQVLHATGPLPSFEVATIKPVRDGSPLGFSPPSRNMFKNLNASARDLVRVAYGMPPGSAERVLGGPGWVDTNHYDVEGKIPDALFAEIQKMPPQEQRSQRLMMVQAMLADRFKLKVHFEEREMPIYELVAAKGGPKLTPAKEPPPESDTTPHPAATGGFPRPEDMRQGILVFPKTSAIMEMTAKGQTMDVLVQVPFFGLGSSPVLNKTGLTGKYDFTLDWTPEQPARPTADDLTTPAEPDAPSLLTALQEQLGLKLIPTKGPVEVIVIDHIELPSEN